LCRRIGAQGRGAARGFIFVAGKQTKENPVALRAHSSLDASGTLRPLAPIDLDAVVAIDAQIVGRSRRDYFERRLRAALRAPALHLQFAVDVDDGLAGYVLARKLAGEFGRSEPAYRVEVIGVHPGKQGHGIGDTLLKALQDAARRHDTFELRTQAAWNDHEMLRFLDHAGFEIGRNQVIDCAVHAGRIGSGDAEPVPAPEERHSGEIDHSAPPANDFEALARDQADVSSLQRSDLDQIERIDRRLTGQDRTAYIERIVNDAMQDSVIRVSLAARVDGAVVGFIMAGVDYGDFGRTEPVAVIDTIGVDPGFTHKHIGSALLSQLFVNLEALQAERVETVVTREDFGLLAFFYNAGFGPSRRLAFVKRLD
jgi:predicted N-acetyltransferase YhbS